MGRLHGVLVQEGQATVPFRLTRVITTGGVNRKLQGNGVSRLHDVIGGFGNLQGKGDVVAIGINPNVIVTVSRCITLNLKTPIR